MSQEKRKDSWGKLSECQKNKIWQIFNMRIEEQKAGKFWSHGLTDNLTKCKTASENNLVIVTCSCCFKSFCNSNILTIIHITWWWIIIKFTFLRHLIIYLSVTVFILISCWIFSNLKSHKMYWYLFLCMLFFLVVRFYF